MSDIFCLSGALESPYTEYEFYYEHTSWEAVHF